MLHYRVYHRLPLEDFMEHFSFVIAKCGYLVTPIIQDINYMRTVHKEKTKEDWKTEFVQKLKKELNRCNKVCNITYTEKYYDVWLEFSEE